MKLTGKQLLAQLQEMSMSTKEESMHGIYTDGEGWCLFINGEWTLYSMSREDCVSEAKNLGHNFT